MRLPDEKPTTYRESEEGGEDQELKALYQGAGKMLRDGESPDTIMAWLIQRETDPIMASHIVSDLLKVHLEDKYFRPAKNYAGTGIVALVTALPLRLLTISPKPSLLFALVGICLSVLSIAGLVLLVKAIVLTISGMRWRV